jgi:hypothetical protein
MRQSDYHHPSPLTEDVKQKGPLGAKAVAIAEADAEQIVDEMWFS